MTSPASPQITTETLAAELGAPDLKLVDGSWHMPASGRNARAEFEARHIPGAVFFDIDAIADPLLRLPHMVAKPADFAKAVGDLGISETDRIVVYDADGLMGAARVWWNFKVMGAGSVFVLRGGLRKWIEEGRKLASGPSRAYSTRFKVRMRPGAVVTAEGILTALKQKGTMQIVDVRPAARFNKEADEPRPGLRRGAIPGSVNLPYAELIENGALKDAAALLERIRAAGIDPDRPVITSCGSGVTAAILNLALAELGKDQMRLYDGSWAEWGANPAYPIE